MFFYFFFLFYYRTLVKALEEELRVVGNNLQTLEVGEEKSRLR